MYRTVTFSAFCDAFRALDRQDSFSYEAKRCLFDYLEDYEDSTGTPVWHRDPHAGIAQRDQGLHRSLALGL